MHRLPKAGLAALISRLPAGNEVCRQLRAWAAEGLPLPAVAINLSARQLQQDDLVGAVERIVLDAGIDAALLEFELTESMLMKNPEAAVETLRRIRAPQREQPASAKISASSRFSTQPCQNPKPPRPRLRASCGPRSASARSNPSA